MTKVEKQDLCICPVCSRMFFGNPDADDQRCFEHWFEANEDSIPDQEQIGLEGAGGFNYHAIPNTIKEMNRADWIDYVAHLPRNAFVQSIYRTILHNSATLPKNGIKVFIGFQLYHLSHGWADIGYHGGWTPDGKSYLCRNWTYKGAHAHAVGNRGSLGLVMVGSFSGNGFPTEHQIREYGWLANLISNHLSIKYNSGHRWEDNHPTSCPGYNITRNLINLWASDQPIPEEDDMFSQMVEFKNQEKQGELFVQVAAEGWYDLGRFRGEAWLIIKNENKEAASIEIFTTPFSGGKKIELPGRDDEKSRESINMANFAPIGGYATTIKSTLPVTAQISIIAEKS